MRPRSGRCRADRHPRSAGQTILTAALLALIAAGCGGSATSAPRRSNEHPRSHSTLASTPPLSQQAVYVAHYRRLRPGQACPVTRASSHPRVPAPMLRLLNGDRSSAYGRGPLWVLLPARGNNASRVYGQVYVKAGWYVGLPAPLRGAARRIDGRRAQTGRLQTPDPNTAAGRMEASALLLPTPGCWQVTGDVAGHSLTWVFRARLRPPPKLR